MAPPENGDVRTSRIFEATMAAPAVGRPGAGPSTVSRDSTGPLNMKSEVNRLSTFLEWPVPFMSKHAMVSAGFYYLRKPDVVRCAFCGVEVGRWEEGDNPMEEHRRWSPSCPLVRKTNNGGKHSAVYDECGLYGIQIRPNSGPENSKHCEAHLLEQLGINKSRGPAHPGYVSQNARAKSFESWPKSLKPRPEQLVEAGFFYTGKSDQTLCFNCGCGLKDWQPMDDPWIEHAKWSPQCTFVVLNKGKDFVQSALSKEQPLLLPEDMKNLCISKVKEAEKSVDSRSARSDKTAETSAKPVSDSRLCKICLQEELGVVFLPCGHLVACVKCAPTVNNCPICRKPLTATVRAFLS